MTARKFFLAMSIAAAALTVHSFMLSGSFKSIDDRRSIVDNQKIRSLEDPAAIFTDSFFGRGTYYRPLVTYSFALEYHFIKLNPFFYHLTNLLIHAAVSLVAFFLLNKLLPGPAAFFGALIYAVHPVHWEAVANIPGRAILLCALFYLSAFLFFLKSSAGRTDAPAGKTGKTKSYTFYALSLLSFAFAIFCKESAVMLPPVLLLYQFLVGKSQEGAAKTARTAKAGLLAPLLPVLPFFAVTAFYLLTRGLLGINRLLPWDTFQNYVLGFFTFLRSLLTHIRVLVFPTGLYYDRAERLFSSFTDPGLFLTLFVWTAAAAVFIRCRRRISGPVMFLILWFFAEFALISQLFSSIGVQPGYISAADHFLYIPAVPAAALIALAGTALYEKNKTAGWTSTGIFWSGAAGLLLFLAVLAVSMNIQAANERAMFENSLAHNPHNARVRNSLALIYARAGLYKEAETHYRTVVADNPLSSAGQLGLGRAMQDQGRLWDAVNHYDSVWIGDPEHRAIAVRNRREALRDLEQKYLLLLKQQPDNIQASYSLGVVYAKDKRFARAIETFHGVLAADPRHHNAMFNLAASYFAAGRLPEARTFYAEYLKTAPENDPLREAARATLEYLKEAGN